MFLIKVNIFYLLLWYLIRSSMANDFCEKFSKNNFSIDYGFGGIHKQIKRTDPIFSKKGWIVIEDNICRFEVNKNNGSIDLVSMDGSDIPFGLTKGIKMAFIGIDGNLGLIDKNDSIHMTSFADSNETKDKYNFKEKIEFNSTGNRRYIPFTFKFGRDSMIIGFMSQYYNCEENQFERDVAFYQIYKDHINKLNVDPDSSEITKTIYKFDKSIEIMAIFGPYIMEYKLISKTTQIGLRPFERLNQSFGVKPIKKIFPSFKQTFDYLILIKVNKSIQYFFTSDNITNQYKTLIDCRYWPISVGNFDSENPTKDLCVTRSAVTDILVSFIKTTAVLLILMVPLWIGYRRWSTRLRQLPQFHSLPYIQRIYN